MTVVWRGPTSCTREWPSLDVQDGHGQDSPNGKKCVTKKDTNVDLSQGRAHVGITQPRTVCMTFKLPLPFSQSFVWMRSWNIKKRTRGGLALPFPLSQSMAPGGVLIYVSQDLFSRSNPSCSIDTAEARGEMSNVINQWTKGGRWRDRSA